MYIIFNIKTKEAQL